jgi:hypothetical protein
MSKDWTIDFAFDKLKHNEKVIRGAELSNEATTRLRAIDTILFDFLGWDKLNVETEKYCRYEGFSDYCFLQGSSIRLILEAKKSGTTFLLPARSYQSRAVGFGLLAKECPGALDAMTQAAGYAASEGSRYVAISNGHQWLLALSFVTDQPISERLVYVFESFEAIVNRFGHFWKCFSPSGIYNNSPAPELLESRKAPAPAKLSSSISNYPVPANRNVIVNELGYILSLVWDEMNVDENDEEFLRRCYIRPDASEDSISIAKELLSQRRETDELATTEAYDSNRLPDLVKHYATEKPIVVLGGIGHGKSIFLKYLRTIKAKKELKPYIQIDIDFLDRPDRPQDVGPYIYTEINRRLLDTYGIDVTEDGIVRGALHFEIQRLKNTPKGKLYHTDKKAYKIYELEKIEEYQRDCHFYLTKVFKHLKQARGYSLGIFLDNLDRRHDPIQEEAFLMASAMARDWASLVFVCLRPDTFYRSKRDGVLDSVAPKLITVASPKTMILLKKRFQYAREIAEGFHDSREHVQRGSLGREVTLSLPSVASFFDCCIQSLANKDLVALFDAVCNGNVRDLLRYTNQIITSKHLNTEKILEKIPSGYLIPVHEVLRALLYGNSMHYDPDRSVFVNLFDIVRVDPMEHFSRFLALHYLNRVALGPQSGHFCAVADIIQYLCQLGYAAEHVRDTIEFLYGKACCTSRVVGLRWSELSTADVIRITTLGRYHVNALVNSFQYFDAITVDTPILDEQVRKITVDVDGIIRRLNRADAFVDYLDKCSNSIQDSDAIQLWKDSFGQVKAEIRAIRAKEERKRSHTEQAS